MVANHRKKIQRLSYIIAASLLTAFLFGWIFKTPELRKYPDREPIIFWHMWTSQWKVIIDDICTQFNESQNTYEVIPLSIPKGIATSKFLMAVTGNEPPDCMAQWQQVVPQFADNQLILPMKDVMSPDELVAFKQTAYPIARKLSSYKGETYCMPLAMDVRACYYRLDHLKKAGLMPDTIPSRITTQEDFNRVRNALPDSLEELVEWGKVLNIFDEKGLLIRLGFIPQKLIIFASVFGGGFYDWSTGKLTIDTPENLRALTFLAKQYNAIGFDRMQRFASSLTGRHGADWPFAIGKRSITIDGQWRVQQLNKFAPDIPYVTAPIPPPKAGGKKWAGWVHGNFMIIPKDAKNKKGAWAFTKFWLGLDNPERAAEFYTRSGWLPPSPQIANTECYRHYVQDHPQFQTFIELLASPNLEPIPPVPFQLQLFDLIKRADDSAMRGTLSPVDALDHLNTDIKAVLSRRTELGYED